MSNFQNTLHIHITHNELRHDHLIYKQTHTLGKYVHLDMQTLIHCTKMILNQHITKYIALSITLVPNRLKEFLKYFEIRKFHNPNLTLEICNVTILNKTNMYRKQNNEYVCKHI